MRNLASPEGFPNIHHRGGHCQLADRRPLVTPGARPMLPRGAGTRALSFPPFKLHTVIFFRKKWVLHKKCFCERKRRKEKGTWQIGIPKSPRYLPLPSPPTEVETVFVTASHPTGRKCFSMHTEDEFCPLQKPPTDPQTQRRHY